MGRGRAKAKQTKVARELKYFSPDTDLSALERELRASRSANETRQAQADDEGDEHLPGRDAEGEQRARGDIAADRVHVGHPEREDVVPAPLLLAQGSEILVREPRVVSRLDVARADGVPRGFDDVLWSGGWIDLLLRHE